MRHYLLYIVAITAFLFGNAHANAQGTNVTLIVTTVDGVEQTYQLTDAGQLYFEDGETLVIDDGTDDTIRYELANIRKIVCSEVTGTPESNTSKLLILPSPTHDHFMVKNLATPCQARIFSLDGRLVKVFEVQDGHTIDISELSEGMYLLHLNGETLKLMKL